MKTSESHIEMLRKQLADMTAQRDALAEIVKTIPSIITNARLDAKAGVETSYNYAAAEKALSATA